MASWKVVISARYLVYLAALGLANTSVNSPPTITQHPSRELTFTSGLKVVIPCEAIGEPAPLYKWKRNDQPLTINNIHIVQSPGVGSIVISDPISSDQGVYQCIATNKFGSALSIRTILKKAVLDPFPTVREPKEHRPFVGMPLTLHCQPPVSYPEASVYWGESRVGDRIKPIDRTERISLDYEGNLHFANVLTEDSRSGMIYLCIVQNMELRILVQGDDQKIDPQPISGEQNHEPPKLMWPVSNTSEVALKGQSKKMKCIFSGYPTPSVNWTRVDAPLPSKVIISSFGQEITIPDTDYSDAGSYRCTGTNTVSETSRTVTLRVESPPYWKTDNPPEDVITSEEEYARFDCQAIGQPEPEIAWFINGVPVQELPPNPRRSVAREYLIYRNITRTDVQVIQCNASNIHGYIFANAFLNVLAEPPSFIDTPQGVVNVTERQNVTLTCQVFGAPKPVITWKRTDIGSTFPSKAVSGDRFILESSGNLRILNAKTEDQGTYYCEANNKFGQDEASGNLFVREDLRTTVKSAGHQLVAPSAIAFVLLIQLSMCLIKLDGGEKLQFSS